MWQGLGHRLAWHGDQVCYRGIIACADVQCTQQGNPSAHAGCPNFLTFACMLHCIAKKVESQLAALPLSYGKEAHEVCCCGGICWAHATC